MSENWLRVILCLRVGCGVISMSQSWLRVYLYVLKLVEGLSICVIVG